MSSLHFFANPADPHAEKQISANAPGVELKPYSPVLKLWKMKMSK
jgi:hypothetical protein